MSKEWIGRCAVCGRTSGYFQRATYVDAPDGGVSVHPDCMAAFFKNLEDEQWKLGMEQAYQEEDERLYRQDLLAHVAFLRGLDGWVSTDPMSKDSHGVAVVGEHHGAKIFGARANTRNFRINDDGVDLELWLQFKTRLAWGHIDFKTSPYPDYLVVDSRKTIPDEMIYIRMQHSGVVDRIGDFFERTAKPLGWMFGRDVKKYPITKNWLGNKPNPHLVPAEELRNVDEIKARYQGRWRWHDVPDHPLKHPKEGFPARYQPK